MKLRSVAWAVILVALCTLPGDALGAPTVLKNDTYAGGTFQGGLQQGFSAGESFAALFTPPSYPFRVDRVQAFIADVTAGSVNSKEFTLLIYQDTKGSKEPGKKLLDLALYLTPSQSQLLETDASTHNIVITSGDIRVQYRQLHTGAPSIVRDTGPRKTKRNLIHGDLGTGKVWHWVDDLTGLGMNVPGNWIIRVASGTGGSAVDLGPGAEAGAPAADSGSTTQKDQGGMGNMGGERQPCYPNKTCNAGLTCLSDLCVKAPEERAEEEGCAVAGGARGAGPWVLLLGLLGLVRRRGR